MTRRVIDSCPNLKLITVLATGYNVVDVAYAKEKGIPVCNVPNYGGYSVSQFTIALMLEACLHIGHHDRTVHEGKWQNSPDWCYWDYPLVELAGKTFGLLGCGRIGIHTAEAAKGLGMHVIAYNLSLIHIYDTDKRTNANGLAAAPIFLFCDFIISVLSCQSFSKKQGRTGRSSETE